MAQRPFEPTRHGWKKVEYRQSDILEDRDLGSSLPSAQVADDRAHAAHPPFMPTFRLCRLGGREARAFLGVRDEVVGIIARREAGAAAAARNASTTRDDEELTVADSIMAVPNPDTTAFSTGDARLTGAAGAKTSTRYLCGGWTVAALTSWNYSDRRPKWNWRIAS